MSRSRLLLPVSPVDPRPSRGAEPSTDGLASRLRPSERTPVLFVGHGNPVRESEYTRTGTQKGRAAL